MFVRVSDAQKFKQQFEGAMENNKTGDAAAGATEDKPAAPKSDAPAPVADAAPTEEAKKE